MRGREGAGRGLCVCWEEGGMGVGEAGGGEEGRGLMELLKWMYNGSLTGGKLGEV